ncbi:MAG: lactonase family protein [Opitutaceae bacterium]|nr:lactonase family protein [Opitutaceae bacterium]
MAASHLIFLGTYTKGSSQGIYTVRLDGDTGTLSAPALAAAAPDPAWITLTPDNKFLYAIHPSAAQAIGFSVDAARGALTPLPAAPAPAAQPPSHLAVDATGRVLLAANYREGYVAAMAVHADGSLGPPSIVRHEGKGMHPTRQEKPHAHSVTLSPDNRHVIVADLGVDKIFSYALDPASATLRPAAAPFVAAPPGAGPRHFTFGATGRPAYAINELANTITAYDYDAASGALAPRQTVSTLAAGYTAPTTTAEIRVHPNGRFLYGSNRGHDSIAVFAIDAATGLLSASPIEIVATGGRNPRNFALSPDGRWLVCGHQDTELVTVFRVDAATGRLTPTPHPAAVPSVVCVLFLD